MAVGVILQSLNNYPVPTVFTRKLNYLSLSGLFCFDIPLYVSGIDDTLRYGAWINNEICDAWPERRQTFGCLPSCRASPLFGRLVAEGHGCEQLA